MPTWIQSFFTVYENVYTNKFLHILNNINYPDPDLIKLLKGRRENLEWWRMWVNVEKDEAWSIIPAPLRLVSVSW